MLGLQGFLLAYFWGLTIILTTIRKKTGKICGQLALITEAMMEAKLSAISSET